LPSTARPRGGPVKRRAANRRSTWSPPLRHASAIPKLLDMLAIEEAIVTIDAMGRQRDIAQKVVDRKADYVLALKGNKVAAWDDDFLAALVGG